MWQEREEGQNRGDDEGDVKDVWGEGCGGGWGGGREKPQIKNVISGSKNL